ncbi:MAG: dolichyl-phosphate-mannose-protein mannosyltransferase [Parcubacteria group bacterium Licking1014_17]|nr:MAG: dolichyl-phosphate-mannose-protein mannosyltransferase [Parcubacteria group bacterium Licking1014_17]
MGKLKKYLPVIIVLVVGFAVYFAYYGHPSSTVFDEVHFGKFINGYLTHEYFFDIHPPLGKLIITGVASLTDYSPTFGYLQIGDEYPDKSYMWLRLLPTLCGALLPLIIWLLCLKLGLPRRGAFFAAIAVALNNAFLAQSRYILMDAFLLLFGFMSLWLYFKYYRERKIWVFVLSAVLATLAFSIKWTGATFWLVIVLADIYLSRKSFGFKWLWTRFIILIILPFALYFSIFAVHFKLLYKSGPGDAFMTPQFRKTLIGSEDSKNPDLKPLGIFSKFTELNTEMYRSNARLTAGHPYSSKWYTWPLMIRPIYYWNEGEADSQARIYQIGNPLLWWFSTIYILYVIISVVLDLLAIVRRKPPEEKFKLRFFLAAVFAINLLPFIGITRAMFLYHYFTALIFAIIAMGYIVGRYIKSNRVIFALMMVFLACFIFFAPLTYGLLLSDKAYNARVWLKTWR